MTMKQGYLNILSDPKSKMLDMHVHLGKIELGLGVHNI